MSRLKPKADDKAYEILSFSVETRNFQGIFWSSKRREFWFMPVVGWAVVREHYKSSKATTLGDGTESQVKPLFCLGGEHPDVGRAEAVVSFGPLSKQIEWATGLIAHKIGFGKQAVFHDQDNDTLVPITAPTEEELYSEDEDDGDADEKSP